MMCDTDRGLKQLDASLSLMLCHGMQQLQALGDTVGVVSRGASQHVLDSLRKTSYAQHQPDHGKESCTEQ